MVNLLGGLIRICVFLGYILAVSQLKEIRRVFQYHGAEHKAVYCYENNLPLTVENAQKFPTLHPRCGTSFACPCGQPPGAFARGGGRVL